MDHVLNSWVQGIQQRNRAVRVEFDRTWQRACETNPVGVDMLAADACKAHELQFTDSPNWATLIPLYR